MKRTNALMVGSSPKRPNTADAGVLRHEKTTKEASAAPAVQEPQSTETTENAQKDLKKGVKAVSFLSRLMGSKKAKETMEEPAPEAESGSNDGRPEGNDAVVFAQPIDNMGYSPRHPQPPAYIKVRAKNKKQREFDNLFLAQELHGSKKRKVEVPQGNHKLRRKSSATPNANTVWAMEFSKDGKHLAAAGVDTVVRVWSVLSSSDDRQNHEKQESKESEANGTTLQAGHLSAPVFLRQPVREFEGHTSTVLDLSWSKNNFLLSSSMDKTVRLWHMSRAECLCTFNHNDFVPSISFHPKDDRFFLAGSLDQRLRLWSIPDKGVAYSVQLPDMITAVAFTPDGKYCIAGCLSGLCVFYETEGLKYQTQIHNRSTRGQNAKGSKITGIQAHHSTTGDIKLLITSNDSRVRLYNFRDKSLELKFRGNVNSCSQIRASLSDDGRYVVSGSEDRKAYLWSLDALDGDKRDKHPMEMFEAHDTITTCVCMAPSKTRQLLAQSEDPVYDLCNPPPVTLRSRAERAQSEASSRPPTESGSGLTTPADVDARFDKPRPSSAYWNRSDHKGGSIIVTADFMGKIKVFRQDCASSKRKSDDAERASLFTKRSGRASVSGSLATKNSQRSLRSARGSVSTQAPSERILSWRQGIASNGARRSTSKHTSRSISPRKSTDTHGHTARPHSVKSTRKGSKGSPEATDDSQPPPLPQNAARHTKAENHAKGNGPYHSSKDHNPIMIEGNESLAFWDTGQWKQRAEKMRQLHQTSSLSAGDGGRQGSEAGPGRLTPSRGASVVSKLSIERSEPGTSRSVSPGDNGSGSGDEENFDDAREEQGQGQGQGQESRR